MIEWLDEFYGSEDMRDTLLKSFLPVFSSYVSEAVGPVSSSFVQALAEGYVERHLGSSRAQLQEIVKDSENPVVDLTARFDEWEEKRPGKVSANETVRAANAATLEQMRDRGVTHKRWVTQGTCPFCAEMAGRTTTINKTFLRPGDALHPEGVEVAMTIKAPVGHPPLHRACKCSVEPATVTVSADAKPDNSDVTYGEAISEWTNNADVGKDVRDAVINGRPLNGASRTIVDLIANHSTEAPRLYRGLATRDPDRFVPGGTIDLGPSSFSSSKRIAGDFIQDPTGGLEGERTLVLIRLDGAQAANIESLAPDIWKQQQEWITSGRFRVTSVGYRGDILEVNLVQEELIAL